MTKNSSYESVGTAAAIESYGVISREHTVDAGSRKTQPVRACLAAFLGTTVEWYDFFIYSNATALIFDKIFFPDKSSYIGTLIAFATAAVGYFMRPLGAVIFGHIGDRVGRKKSLIATITLMAISTVGVGLLPTYGQLGVMSVYLLLILRICQGIAAGGEWGGAVLIAGEHTSKKWRTFAASFAQLGSPAALILAMLVFGAIAKFDQPTLLGWGWRLPFLGSFVLFIIGIVVRAGVKESPEFEAVQERNEVLHVPLVEVLKQSWGLLLLATGALLMAMAGGYITNIFLLSYATKYMHIPALQIINVLTLMAVFQFFWTPVAAWIADKFGGTRSLLFFSAVAIVVPYPMFALVSTKVSALMLLGCILATLTKSSFYAISGGYLAQIFATNVRYTAISLAYHLAGAVASLVPILGTMLAQTYKGSWLPLAILFSVLCVVSFVCVLFIPGRMKRQLEQVA